jgi:hypothetical protein
MKKILLLGTLLCFLISFAQPPSNDECDGAILLNVSSSMTCTASTAGTTVGATASSQNSTGVSGTPDDDVRYYFEATQSAHRIALTNVVAVGGFSTDMGIAIYSGDCQNQLFLATSDPETFFVQNLQAGETYYIRVYGWGSGSNDMNFNICVSTPPNFDTPDNDECDNAISLPVNSSFACAQTIQGTTGGATASSQASNGVSGTPDNDVWFVFEAVEARHKISLTNVVNLYESGGVDMGMAVYSGDCSELAFFGTSDPDEYILNGLIPGETYYVRVYTWRANSHPAQFNICVTTVFNTNPPANDDCDNAISLPINTNLTCATVTAGTTGGATASSQSSTGVVGVPNDDVWYSFTATQSSHKVTLSNVVSLDNDNLTDMAMAFYSGDCSSLIFINSTDPNNFILNNLEAGETYYVRVYGYSQSSSAVNFNICIGSTIVFEAPENDECDGAIMLDVNPDYNCSIKTSGTTGGATPSSQSTTGVSGTPNNDVWYSFVATGAVHRISLSDVVDVNQESDTDMGMAVYSGDCTTPVFVGTSDPDVYNLTSLVAGTTYYVRVYGWRQVSSPMNFKICIGGPAFAEAPLNDNCEDAIVLTVNNDYNCGVITAGTTHGATASSQATTGVSGTPNNDVWYTFTATSINHRISLTNIVNLDGGFSTDMGIAIYSGSCSSPVFIGSSDPETYNVSGLEIGEDYYVRVYGWGTSAIPMNFNICIGTPEFFEPPVNDDCEDAIVLEVNSTLQCDVVTAGTTLGATASSQSTTGVSGTPNNDVWYIFTATSSEHRISLRNIVNQEPGSFSTDMGIAVYSGGCSSPVFIGSSDPEVYNLTGLEVGEDYYVRVYGWGTSAIPMNFNICIATPVEYEAPQNDECSNAIELDSNTEGCANAVNGTTAGATASPQPTTGASGTPNNDVWYYFTASETSYSFSLGNIVNLNEGSSTDMGVAVYSGGCESPNLVVTSDPENFLINGLTVGEIYFIRVYGWGASSDPMSFSLCLSKIPSVPENDICSNAIMATLPYSVTQNAVSATNNGNFPSCNGTAMNDGVWYSFDGTGGSTTVTINPTGWDPALGIYSGSCNAFTCVTRTDSSGSGGSETYTFVSQVGVTYYVNIGHYGTTTDGLEGLFDLEITSELSTDDFEKNTFKVYPNPVKDVLHIDYTSDISSVSVYNLLGQEVLRSEINSNNGELNMTNLSSCTYLVKIMSGNLVKTMKVIKQ